MSSERALLVEDSSEFQVLGRRVLEREGFDVDCVSSAEEALERASRDRFELFLIDVGLPGIDGFELCRQLRQHSDAYIVMVTGHDEEAEKIVGLRIGADDYVTKPYSPLELAARVHAMRRRPRQRPESPTTTQGRLVVDRSSREVVLDGALVELTRIEFDLLDVLTESPRRVLTRAQLLERVWGYADGDDHVVSVHLGNLRRKLRERADDVDPIRTVRGVGYRFEPLAD